MATQFRVSLPDPVAATRRYSGFLILAALTACGTVAPPDAPPGALVPLATAPDPKVDLGGPTRTMRPKAPLPRQVARAPARPAAPAHPPEGAIPRVEKPRIGPPNVPYAIDGETYFPATGDLPWLEVGTASWYGHPFHGRRTSNGEVYDMHGMTAAHKTMPLPSYAQVTNRRNGRSVIVRVNDRGPFVDGRVIDLSHAAAQRLGITGLGQVEVRRLTNADILSQSWRQPANIASSR